MTWKTHERRTAKLLGGIRTGQVGNPGPDVLAPGGLVVECKQRFKLPGWIGAALAKVRREAGRDRLGVVVAHEHGGRDSWVVMALSDFKDWLDGPGQ